MYVRRALFALAVLVAPALAAAAQPQAPRGASQWAILVGLEDGAGDTGLQLRGDLEFVQRRLSPEVGLSIVGSLGFSRFSESGGGYNYLNGFDNRWDRSLNLLRFGGSARFNFGRWQKARPYADAGLGLYYAGSSGNQTVYLAYPYNAYTSQGYDDSDVGLFLRFAGGVSFPLSPTFALGFELGFQPYLGDVPDDTLTSFMGSATFRM